MNSYIPHYRLFFALSWIIFIFSLKVQGQPDRAPGNHEIKSFSSAKKILATIQEKHPKTLYCNCNYNGKRIDPKSCGYQVQGENEKQALRLEWEHVVPAEAFGQAFKEWREGDPSCVTKTGKPYKGRKCAEHNPEFVAMESDLYNLWPEIGELNRLRSNYSMAEISEPSQHNFGKCLAKISDRKFQPMDDAKGTVARTYMYMDLTFPGRGVISNKNEKLFAAWDKMYPAKGWECERAQLIKAIQKSPNPILESRCETGAQ